MSEFAALDSFLSGDHGGKGSSNGSKSSLLPQPMSPAWYNAEEKEWYCEKDMMGLSKKKKESLACCDMYVQYAPTGRATCRRCGETIDKGVLRLGYPFRYRACEDPQTVFIHAECYEPDVFGIREKELRSKVLGYEALNNTERARLWKAMRSVKSFESASSEGAAVAKEYSKGIVGLRKVPPVPVPKAIVVPMLPFQKEGLAWMCQQEESPARGGILADEMGMGKTIQAISLLLARPQKAPCLVVCPMGAVNQWADEIRKFTAKDSLRTFIYHGAQKSRILAEFRKADVVICTYQTLETDYRKETNKQRVACKYCKKLFLPEKLTFHQKYFCGPDAQRTVKQRKTDIKHKDAAKKAMETMGIGTGASKNSVYAPPTITNIYKDYMKQAGVDVKAKGYWNVMREGMQRANNAGSSSSSSKAQPVSSEDVLSRERLRILERSELVKLCEKRGLDTSGRKPDIIERLMDFSVRGGKANPDKKLGAKLMAQAKAKAKAKASAAAPRSGAGLILAKSGGSSKYLGVSEHKTGKWQASFQGTYLGLYPSELAAARAYRDAADKAAAGNTFGKNAKGKKAAALVQAIPRAPGSLARTAASERAARVAASSSSASSGKGGKAGKVGAMAKATLGKRKAAEMEKSSGGAGPSADVEYVTYEGAQLDLSDSALHSIQWSRIILDEAHRIKGRTNSTALAAYALQTKNGFKWCLTGTPLQNRVGELYSLIRFIRLRPFAFYYCKIKGCNCECSRFMRERYCPNCGHVRFCHYSCFKSKVSNPIIKYGYMGAGKVAFETLRNDILRQAMLRRTKEERKADLKLPPIKVVIRKDKLSQQEQDFYTSLYKQSCVKFDTFIESGTILHNYAHIFDLLTSLRRAVDHPYLIVYGGGKASHKLPSGKSLGSVKSNDICALCQEDVLDDGEEPKRVAKCGHVFHDDCIKAYIADAPEDKKASVGCPACFAKLCVDLEDKEADSENEASPTSKGGRSRGKSAGSATSSKKVPSTPMKVPASSNSKVTPQKGSRSRSPAPRSRSPAPRHEDSKPNLALCDSEGPTQPKKGKNHILQQVSASQFQSSTKIEALVDEVQKMKSADKTAKGIVFSQFGAMLELVEFRLKKAGISCVIYRGGMSMDARTAALAAFNTDPSLKVILISLKAGGEGLNLQIANHVFLLDPWWNPACELQAIQRAHRIGQTKQVKAVRLISENTIEEKILKLQEKKQLVFDASIDGSQASLVKLTEQDLRFLFQH